MQSGEQSGGGDPMLLMSWNVAGWKTTLEQIKRFKGGLSEFLRAHHVDILCLQEVKVTSKALATEGATYGIEPAGFESFWACNEGAGSQRQGLNGVATYARRGQVLRADCAPLQVPELDREGRCLLTDHGSFVLFNVYVPNHADGSRLPFKLRWLRALRKAMQRERAAKPVILAGDLNLKWRCEDSHFTGRAVRLSSLQDFVKNAEIMAEMSAQDRAAAEAACAACGDIFEALRGRELQQIETRNSHNGQAFKRWGVFAKAVGGASAGELVRLGDPISSEEEARAAFRIEGCGVEDEGTLLWGAAAREAAYVLQHPGELRVGEVAECMRKLAGIEMGPELRRRFACEHGRVPTPPAVVEWIKGVLEEDNMVDSLSEFHPAAEERFTCWDQYRNRRYQNVGSRIDFILVDKAFFGEHAKKGSESLRAFSQHSPTSPGAALSAAILGGLSQPSPYGGGGMQKLEDDEYAAQFQGFASTGLVYTPPQLSDHIAISLLMQGAFVHDGAAAKDAATQKCQPYRAAKRISDFFAAPAKKPRSE